LGPFIAEGRTAIIKLEREFFGRVEFVAHDAPDHPGGEFRPQSDAPVAFIQEGVHLFADDVAAFASSTRENLGVFEDRGNDFAIGVKFGGRFQNVGDVGHRAGVFPIDIMGSFDWAT
jgi:hypothetical protein